MPTLSEADSKARLREHGVPVATERLVSTSDEAVAAAEELGYPVVVKLCGPSIAHKTERGLVRLGLRDAGAVRDAATELLEAVTPDDGPVGVLVGELVRGNRELIAGLVRDAQFGPCVMLGVGGILAEAIADVAFRLVPLTETDARELIDDLQTQALLGELRGEPAIDRSKLVDVLVGLSRLAETDPSVVSVDVNPLIVRDGVPIAVDALRGARRLMSFEALFEPKGVVVAGASTHPAKFGFTALHNILANGYRGKVFATNLEGETVLGVPTVPSIDHLPDGEADLVFVCTPAAANVELLKSCAAKGVRAAFITSGGYGEAGEAGKRSERELVELARSLGILLAGPNGQGVVSTPVNLCAQIVAPYPPPGRISIASQSGNFVSSFLNYAIATGIGVARAVSAGNAAATTVADYLDWYASDDATAVGLAYVEGIDDGRAFYERVGSCAARKPLVVVKGGATAGGQHAAASHTGSLASDDRIFDGVACQAGLARAATIEEAYEVAATFATQPLPRGGRTVVVTTAGGWGVVTADAISRSPVLELIELPDDLLAAIDEKLPPRWSRNNPIDMAGGETRDTIPEVLSLVAAHPDVDAVIYLGLGIQSNTARMLRTGGFYPDHGLERIVAYHERQDQRFAEAAAAASASTGKPVLTATELAVAMPDNPGPASVRESGRVCYPSANRAVAALEHLVRYARWRERRGL